MYGAAGAAGLAIAVLFFVAHSPLWVIALADAYIQFAARPYERFPPLLSAFVLIVTPPWMAWLVTSLVEWGTGDPVELLLLLPALGAVQIACAPAAVWLLDRVDRRAASRAEGPAP